MEKEKELDELISKYTNDLIKLKEKWSKWGIATEEEKPQPPTDSPENEPAPEPETTPEITPEVIPEPVPVPTPELIPIPEPEEDSTPEEEVPLQNQNNTTGGQTAVKPDEEQTNISPEEDLPLAYPENFAMFTASVFAGNQAYPIPNAKVSVYLDNKLHIFLITDENGETRKVKLQSYPEINTFIPDNTEQTLDYSADVQADGFAPRSGLLVSAVGGSDILLNVEMTPLSERID